VIGLIEEVFVKKYFNFIAIQRNNMTGIKSLINKKLSSFFGYDPVTKLRIHGPVSLEKIGSAYGGWVIPGNFLSPLSVCYFAGAGEDLSFDTGIAEKYGCPVFIFDPTPRALQHFETLKNTLLNGNKMPVNNSDVLFYSIDKSKLPLLQFFDYGIWNKEDILKFYVPKDPQHVSHSILNLQKTEEFIRVKVDRLSNIMKTHGHAEIDLLKLDIEGAEYNVLQSIIEDRLKVKVICIEYDEAISPLDQSFLSRIKMSLSALMKYGYLIVDASENCNYTLIRKDVFDELKVK
jgi:FkbM family methyltransferase